MTIMYQPYFLPWPTSTRRKSGGTGRAPGSTTERLLIFADLEEVQTSAI